MKHTPQDTVECDITATKVASLAIFSLVIILVSASFPVSDTAIGKLLTYAIGTFGSLGLITVLCALHLKYVSKTPWAVVTKSALKWFVPTKMSYASLNFAEVERFYVSNSFAGATLCALRRDGSKVSTGVTTAFLSKQDVAELLRVATSRLGKFNSVE